MIEFKADCGHTVRAKDEDAGGTVRCSYCGRAAEVPDNRSRDLDFLLTDLQRDEKGEGVARGKPPRPSRLFPKRKRRPPGQFNPFTVVLKLCYVALLFIIVFVVGKTFILPLFREGGWQRAVTGQSAIGGAEAPAPRPDRPTPIRPERPVQYGLIARDRLEGLLVDSTPSNAMVYCLKADRLPAGERRINKVNDVQRFRAGESAIRLSDGLYVVEVVFPWNAREFSGYRGYEQFRRSIERATFEERKRAVREYFLPDDADDVFIDETDEQIFIVRQYRDIEVRNRRSASGVRALFLPRLMQPDGERFAIEELVSRYLPAATNYAFDENWVEGELRYYGVSDADQPFVVAALKRIGVIPYRRPDGLVRLFKIGLEDGSLRSPVLTEPK
ncbi:MAG: hypothetical protein J5J06_12050 [Phycisphaerae bacterium]|nr:hypothetical protein [Phycisphaerae bacterium]